MKNKSKPTKKPNPANLIRHVTNYDPAFKKAVILYAEKKSISDAKKRYGICESNIRRWRKLKSDILEKAKKSTRRSKKIGTDTSKSLGSNFDSMPLELRLKTPTPSISTSSTITQEQESDILHSHALSPTKLKVTRQSTKPPQVSPKPPTPVPTVVEDVCLKWNGHHTNMQSSFPSLLLKEQHVDATLVAEGQSLKCHKVILSSCSPYFEDILGGISPFQHPVLFMKDVPFWILKSLCDFMYVGEVKVAPDKLQEYLTVAKSLKLKGIEDMPESPQAQIKTEPGLPSGKEEKKADIKDVRDRSRESREIKEKAKEIRESKEKVKDVKDVKEKVRESKERAPKELKEKEVKEKKKHFQPPPPADMPVLKNAKVSKVSQQQTNVEMPILKSSKVSRPAYISKRVEKKTEKSEKKIDKPPDASNIYDPLGLLKAVYEEPTQKSSNTPVKIKEVKSVPARRPVPKKIRKRKISDDREESPPPVLSRKGTRSRPNRKIPKFYHPAYERTVKRVEPQESTIVREPHTVTDQADPLMEFEDIKAEPLDLMDDNIEIEDNAVDYDHEEMPLSEEMMESYDNPLEHPKQRCLKRIKTRDSPILTEPIITSDSVKIVDVADIRSKIENNILLSEDPLNFSPSSEGISITNVQSMMEKEDSLNVCTDMGFCISEVVSEVDGGGNDDKDSDTICKDLGFQITNVVSTASEIKADVDKLPFRITSVVSENQETSVTIKKELLEEGNEEIVMGQAKRICVRKDLEERVSDTECEVMKNHLEGVEDKNDNGTKENTKSEAIKVTEKIPSEVITHENCADDDLSKTENVHVSDEKNPEAEVESNKKCVSEKIETNQTEDDTDNNEEEIDANDAARNQCFDAEDKEINESLPLVDSDPELQDDDDDFVESMNDIESADRPTTVLSFTVVDSNVPVDKETRTVVESIQKEIDQCSLIHTVADNVQTNKQPINDPELNKKLLTEKIETNESLQMDDTYTELPDDYDLDKSLNEIENDDKTTTEFALELTDSAVLEISNGEINKSFEPEKMKTNESLKMDATFPEFLGNDELQKSVNEFETDDQPAAELSSVLTDSAVPDRNDSAINESFQLDKVETNESFSMDGTYPELPDDDEIETYDKPIADSTVTDRSDGDIESNPVLETSLSAETICDNVQTIAQIHLHDKVVSTETYTDADNYDNLQNSELQPSNETDPLAESACTETTTAIPASEKMWSGNTIENISPALSENTVYNFENENSTGNAKNTSLSENLLSANIITETELAAQNICDETNSEALAETTQNIELPAKNRSDAFSTAESYQDGNKNLGGNESIINTESVQNSTELFFNQNHLEGTTSEYDPSSDLVVTPLNLEDYAQESITFAQSGFHIGQVVNEQIASREDRLSMESDAELNRAQDDTQSLGLETNDLESIVNDLTMIVGDSRDEGVVERCDDTNVIADSLENLLEK